MLGLRAFPCPPDIVSNQAMRIGNATTLPIALTSLKQKTIPTNFVLALRPEDSGAAPDRRKRADFDPGQVRTRMAV
jgi:hypothetical protein